uniref:Protein singed n=1 Tax=Aceria tosichella TaxID=561515 RepID=A0A6G1SR25_9ACAR
MWSSTVGLVNGKHRYLTAETFGFKISSNGQQLKRRQQWTIEPFPENIGPDGSISSAASVSSQCPTIPSQQHYQQQQQASPNQQYTTASQDHNNDPCILTLAGPLIASSLSSIKSSSNGSSNSDQDACGEEHENVAIKSHLNKYLAVDSFGNVTCDSDEKTENARFTITICSMSQGRSKEEHIFWAFKNVERGYYLGTTDDGMICCNAKMPKSRAELWHLHLLPARGASFFAIKSLGRKRFARVVADDSNVIHKNNNNKDSFDSPLQVQLDANISWGAATLFQFKYYEDGRYSLLTSDDKLLTNEGRCINWKPANDSSLPPQECLFTLEYHSGYLAFRDSFSQYLAAAGRSSILRSRSIGVSRDELFVFEGVPIQVSMKATFNNRWVSIKQGVDLSANQTETTDKFETFQLTYHKQTQNWSIMTYDCNYWTISQNTNTVSVCRPGDYEGLTRGQFRLIWSDLDASFRVKHVDINRQERWIAARKSGQLFLATSANQEPVKFVMRFQSRRLLNLRPIEGSGFVGLKSASSKHLEANKAWPDSIEIEYSELPSSVAIATGSVGVGCNRLVVSTAASSGLANQTMHQANSSNNGGITNEQKVINVFNVKLNSTKTGLDVFDKIKSNHEFETAKQQKQQLLEQKKTTTETCASATSATNQTLMDDLIGCNGGGIDANNNCMESAYEKDTNSGGVEMTSAPSVASIINSFSSSTKITSSQSSSVTNNEQQQQQNGSPRQQTQSIRQVNSAVSKLASSFEVGNSSSSAQQHQTANNNGPTLNQTEAGPILSSCSAPLDSSSSQQEIGKAVGAIGNSSGVVDQVAQFECCYMKMKANNKYLVVGDGNDSSSIICDATNKACAQAWILELRSHNSIAIRACDNHAYMQMGTNGTIFLSRCDPKDASLWEF